MSFLFIKLINQNSLFKEYHRKNLDFIIDNYYEEQNDYGYIVFENKSTLSVNSITLRILLSSPYIKDYEEYIYSLGTTISSMQNDNGSFKEDFLINDSTNFNFINNDDAILGLIELYLYTENNSYLNQAILSENFFINNYLKNIDLKNNFLLVPEHTNSLLKLYKLTKNESYRDIIKNINKNLLNIQDRDNISNIGNFINSKSEEIDYSYTAIDAKITEGIANAYDLFKNDSDFNTTNFKIGFILGIYNIINLQNIDSDNKINGSISFGKDINLIRIDSTQNTINACIKVLEVLENNNWNYSFYPELNLFVDNIQKSRLSNIEVWYSLFYGVIISIIVLFFIYIIIKIRKKEV